MTTRKSVVAIDESRLDQEWLEQPELITKYGDLESQARYDHSYAKAQFELVQADLMIRVRSNPSKFNLPNSPPMALVEAAVTRHPKYQDAQIEMLRLKKVLDECSVLMSALEHRKKALENLVDLHKTGFYSEPFTKDSEDRERLSAKRSESTGRGVPRRK